MDGAFALKKIEELQPDVVTLDLEMPRMDGMETLRLIMGSRATPGVLFSTHSKEGDTPRSKALALGRRRILSPIRRMPRGPPRGKSPTSSIAKIKVAKRAAGRRLPPAIVADDLPVKKKGSPRAASAAPRHRHLGISTGGPNALQFVLSPNSRGFFNRQS